MRKTIIYAILLLLSLKIQSRSQTHIQDNDSIQLFRTFLKSFADHDRRDIDSGIFGNAAYEKGMDKGKLQYSWKNSVICQKKDACTGIFSS